MLLREHTPTSSSQTNTNNSAKLMLMQLDPVGHSKLLEEQTNLMIELMKELKAIELDSLVRQSIRANSRHFDSAQSLFLVKIGRLTLSPPLLRAIPLKKANRLNN